MTDQHSPASLSAPSAPAVGARRALPLVRRTLCAASLALLLAAGPAAAVAGGVEWPAAKNTAAQVEKAGLTMLDTEQLAMHIHTTLEVFADGEQVTVPADIGIDRSGPAPRYSPLHTHDETGTVHVESAEWRDFTLGQLLTEWGTPREDTRFGAPLAWVDGRPWAGDADDIVFRDGETITLRYTSR
ncbi:hypothetical protein ACH4GG_18490 [Streptomyces albidoflavus]|jgi:hypothetical protein|uniref:Uncharacterized protein n=1 Tax=Streptomyces wadayamensis TaxID=141454 RepID=A0ABR4S739_9ACTN|nr:MULTISPECIES: hypothetical protein [Streptomyces]MYX50575.1 hypothetical protein [Streptomyces sp. SID8385]KDR61458.1 hypothetical protein DC60_14915 [Streptomyces wadayamensis]MCL6278692.1 hypothetical protein [Streptomyces albidoflavus]MCX4467306.1 hypothetical protein [Streptomyces albidoflavus]PKA37246.1 hypothetical protein SM8_025435 [Streptomyces sp. SM8]